MSVNLFWQYHSLSSDINTQGTKQLREDYRIISKIGDGSYSSVYKVENIHNGEIYCAKNYYPQKNRDVVEQPSFYDISKHGKREIESNYIHFLD